MCLCAISCSNTLSVLADLIIATQYRENQLSISCSTCWLSNDPCVPCVINKPVSARFVVMVAALCNQQTCLCKLCCHGYSLVDSVSSVQMVKPSSCVIVSLGTTLLCM